MVNGYITIVVSRNLYVFLPLELVKSELEDEQKFGFNNELIQMEAGETMPD